MLGAMFRTFAQSGFVQHLLVSGFSAVLGDGSQRQSGHPEIAEVDKTQSANCGAEQQELVVHAACRHEFLAAVMAVVVTVPVVVSVVVRAGAMLMIVTVVMTVIMSVAARTMFCTMIAVV